MDKSNGVQIRWNILQPQDHSSTHGNMDEWMNTENIISSEGPVSVDRTLNEFMCESKTRNVTGTETSDVVSGL